MTVGTRAQVYHGNATQTAGGLTKKDLVKMLAELDREGVRDAWGSGVAPDQKKSDEYAFYLRQSGLGLPDRDYYLDAKFKDKLEAYGPHVEKMLTLAGVTDAAAQASGLFDSITELAATQLPQETLISRAAELLEAAAALA